MSAFYFDDKDLLNLGFAAADKEERNPTLLELQGW